EAGDRRLRGRHHGAGGLRRDRLHRELGRGRGFPRPPAPGRPGAARASRRRSPRARAAALPPHAPPGRHAGADGDARALSESPPPGAGAPGRLLVSFAERGSAALGTTRCARRARVSYKWSRAPRARRRGSGGARREPRGSLTAGREVPEHWTGPPEVTEGPGADGPLRAGDCNVGLGYSDVCGREIEPD